MHFCRLIHAHRSFVLPTLSRLHVSIFDYINTNSTCSAHSRQPRQHNVLLFLLCSYRLTSSRYASLNFPTALSITIRRLCSQSDRSRAIPSGIGGRFSCVGAIRSAFSNSRRDQSDCSDFALTKTCDETGRRATPVCLLLLLAH